MSRDQLETIVWIVLIAVVCVLLWKPARAQLFPPPPNTTIRPQDPSPTIKPDAEPCTKRCILPPKEFDRPYSGDLTVVTAHSQDELKEFCGSAYKPGLTLGCARPGHTSCRIIMAPEQIIIAGGWTKALMLRHEIGHCNGWGADHAGQRSRDADEIEARGNAIHPVWKVWPR